MRRLYRFSGRGDKSDNQAANADDDSHLVPIRMMHGRRFIAYLVNTQFASTMIILPAGPLAGGKVNDHTILAG